MGCACFAAALISIGILNKEEQCIKMNKFVKSVLLIVELKEMLVMKTPPNTKIYVVLEAFQILSSGLRDTES